MNNDEGVETQVGDGPGRYREPTDAENAAGWRALQPYRAWHAEQGRDVDALSDREVLDAVWVYEREIRAREREAERARAAADALERDRRQHAEQKERARLAEEAETQRRAVLSAEASAVIADPCRLRAADPASLRAVAAWWKLNADRMTFRLTGDTARAAVMAAQGELNASVEQREAEIERAQEQRLAERWNRRAQGLPPVPVPDPINLAVHVDYDTLGRWLVFNVAAYVLVAGRYVEKTWTDDEDRDVTRRIPVYPDGYQYLVPERCARWAVWQRLTTMAEKQQDPTAADNLRAYALTALVVSLTETPRDDAEEDLQDELRREQGRWKFEPVNEADEKDAQDEEPGTSDDDEPMVAKKERRGITDEQLRRVILRFVTRFKSKENRGPSSNEIVLGVKKNRNRVLRLVAEMAEPGGELVNTGTEYLPRLVKDE